MADLTDEEITARVQHGDTQWFALLVERYEAKLSRYARKFLFHANDVEDLVQEVLAKAFVNLKSFDARRAFSPWIYRIAHNEFVNALKKRGREPLSFVDPDTLLPHGETEEPERSEELKRTLDAGLGQIGSLYREPLVLYYYEGLDYRDISDVLRIPISTVGVRMKRGREALKKIIGEQHD